MVHWRHIQAKTALLLLAQFMAVLGKFKTCGTLASYPGKDSTASLALVNGCVRKLSCDTLASYLKEADFISSHLFVPVRAAPT